MTPGAAARLALTLAIAVVACDGHLDFGAGTGMGGMSGGVTCGADVDCRLPSLHCDLTGSRTCVACTADAQCTTSGSPRCDLALHRCVACLLGADCAATETCVAARCMTTCQDDAPAGCPATTTCHSGVCGSCGDDNAGACLGMSATPLCLSSPGICVGCRTDGDCSGAQPRCDPVNNTCVQCASGGDCAAATPLCDPRTGTCSAG